MKRVDKVLVVGGGSAGFMAALAIHRNVPGVEVALVRSTKVPIIGVGESTTIAFPRFMHDYCGIPHAEFFEGVRPSWKLGIHFEWGSPDRSSFNYAFDSHFGLKRPMFSRIDAYYCLADDTWATPVGCLMNHDRSPCMGPGPNARMNPNFGYHLDAKLLVEFLEDYAIRQGIDVLDGDVAEIPLDDTGAVAGMGLEDGRRLLADLYVDCTGFRSLLLSKTMGVPFVSYGDNLLCDRALAGRFDRDGTIRPYTTTSTMDHGWAWRIEFEHHVTRGYVFSSQFCSEDEAVAELTAKCPELNADDLRLLKFPRGRYEEYWVRNVAAIGNSSGFVEPLEATALHMVTEQVRGLCESLRDCNGYVAPAMQALQNKRFRTLWDDICGFLAVHYRFNRQRETPFWQHCRAETDLTCAADFVEAYQQAGPSLWISKLLPGSSIFGFGGYLALLIGQQVPTEFDRASIAAEVPKWESLCRGMNKRASTALPIRDALALIRRPDWQWGRWVGG